jgi:hypothetical protein
MTEAAVPFPENNSSDATSQLTIQCHLCLRDISYSNDDPTVIDKAYVVCPHCEYHQPTTRRPRGRDMAVFGVSIAAVYVTTIVAIILAR